MLSLPPGTEMFQFPGFASQSLCIQLRDDWSSTSRVAPFGNPRIKAYLQLPVAYRSLSRPSSPAHAKASTIRPYLLKPSSSLHRSDLLTLVLDATYLRHDARRHPTLGMLRVLFGGIDMSKNSSSRPSQRVVTRRRPGATVELAGFEPATPCLQSRCSTN